MIKAMLTAVAVLVTFDAALWQSRYRHEFARACDKLGDRVAAQDWFSGPLV